MHPHLPMADPDAGFSPAGEENWVQAVPTGNGIPNPKGWEAPSDSSRSGRHHVSDWVYVHSRLLKFQAEHLTMQGIPVFKTYQAEVDDSYEDLYNREKKEALLILYLLFGDSVCPA